MYSDFAETMIKGDTHYMQFIVNINGVAQDITTWAKFWLTAKRSYADLDASAVFQQTDLVGGGIVRTTPAAGLCTVTIDPADTSTLEERPELLFVDFQGKDAAGNIWTLAKGTLVAYPQVTRATT